MSENQNRGKCDFSKYDTMRTEQLEEILRLDSETLDNKGADTEKILYITELLVARNTGNITGNTAQESWKSFQKNYLDIEEDIETSVAKPRQKKYALRRIAAAAAVVILLIAIPVSVKALNWGQIWKAIAQWAGETFSFVSDATEPSEKNPIPDNDLTYQSLQEALSAYESKTDFIPSWIPDGYILADVTIIESPIKRTYSAIYKKGITELTIQVQSHLMSDPEKIETDEMLAEVYSVSGIDYYIFKNNGRTKIAWVRDSYMCHISGELTIAEMKAMIDSIGRG